ncbi:MAG: DUF3638 domain-containing protein [Chlamydiales bacterium]|nr:DUF3638 domain-containing protein [Chlamydiales bacterium]
MFREDRREELELLKGIAATTNGQKLTPREIRLKMHALYLVKQNEEQFPKEALHEEARKKILPPTAEEVAKELHFAELYLTSVADAKPLDPSAELLVLENITSVYKEQRKLEQKDPQIEQMEEDPTFRLQARTLELKEKIAAEKQRPQVAVVPKAKIQPSRSIEVYKELFNLDPRKATEAQHKENLAELETKCSKDALSPEDKEKLRSAFCAVLEFTGDLGVRQEALRLLETFELNKVFNKVFVHPQGIYASSRQEGKFPFNPNNIDSKEFFRYSPYILLEVMATTSKTSAEKNGLLGALTTIRQCHGNDEVGLATSDLLDQLQRTMEPDDIKKSLYPLAAMKSMVEDLGITKKFREEYFSKGQKERPDEVKKDLLPNNCPEIGTNDAIEQKFVAVSEDVKVAQSKLPGDAFIWIEGKDPLKLKTDLTDAYTEENKLLAHQGTLILNSVAQALVTSALNTKSYPTIEEIGFMCARKDYDEYAAKNYPELTSEGRNNLQEAVKRYFFQKEAVQQLGRSIKAVDSLIVAQTKVAAASAELADATSKAQPNAGALEEALALLQDEKKSAQDILAQQLDKTRAYAPDHPYAMIFLFLETAIDIKLRSDQVQNILEFANGIISGKNLVMQMIMGSGKTAVIQPFLAILLAKPGALSTVMVPPALFPAVQESLALVLGKVADQMLVSLPYDLELSQDNKYLDTFLKRLHETQEKGGTLIVSPRQIHSLLTSLDEAFYSLSDPTIKEARIKEVQEQLEEAKKTEKKDQDTIKVNQEVFKRRLEKAGNNEEKIRAVQQAQEASATRASDRALKRKERFAGLEAKLAELTGSGYDKKLEERTNTICKIIDFLQNHASVQMDEIHKVMDPDIVYKRPIGTPVVFDAHEDKTKAYARPIFLTELVLDIAADTELNDKVSIDFANAMRRIPGEEIVSRGDFINEQNYIDEVQPKIVEKAINRLMKKAPFKELLINPSNRKIVERFITQKEISETDKVARDEATKDSEWIEAHITNEDDQKLLGSITFAIKKVFPKSLLKDCNTNYGQDPLLENPNPAKRKYVARPYAAPEDPKPTMYAEPEEKIIHSVQYYLFNGIPIRDAEEILLKWQVDAKKEMGDSVGLKVDQTEKFSDFSRVMNLIPDTLGLSFLTDPRSNDFATVVNAFQKAISKDRKTILEFCKDHLFAQNTVYEQSVTSTPQTLAGSSQQTIGYTGTLHEAILAPSMQALAEKGTDGMTILAMNRKFATGAATVTSLTKEQKPADEVIAQFMDPEYYVCMDSGNWLKEEKLDAFALKLLKECETSGKRPDISGVIYHNTNGVEVCVEKNENEGYTVLPLVHSRLKPEQRLTIIRSKNETGTNILQKPTAKCFRTIRKNMILPDELQSAFRMRGILLGQSVSEKLSVEVKSHMAQSLLKGLLSHVSYMPGVEINKKSFFEEIEGLDLSITLRENLSTAIDTYNNNKKYTLLNLQECFSDSFVPDESICLRYFTANQAKVELDKNWDATRHKMQNAFAKPIRAVRTNTALSLEDRKALFNHPEVKKFLVKKEAGSHFAEFLKGETKIDRDEAVQKEKVRYTNALKAVINDDNLSLPMRLQLAANLMLPEGSDRIALKEKLQALSLTEKLALPMHVQLVATLVLQEKKDELQRLALQQNIEQLSIVEQKKLAASSSIEALTNALDKCVNLKDLPEKIRTTSTTEGEGEIEEELEEEVEKETELEQEVELENEAETEAEEELEVAGVKAPATGKYQILANPLKGHKNSYDINGLYTNKKDFKSLDKILPKEVKLPARDKIEYSTNFITNDHELGTAAHAENHLSARYMLILQENNKPTRYIMVSNVDADKIKEGFGYGSVSAGRRAVLCDLNNSSIIEQSHSDASNLIENDEAKSLLLQVKFLMAKPILKSTEVKELAKFIKVDDNDINLEACRTYYENCLKYLETPSKTYPGSTLEKMLNGKYPLEEE